MRTLPARSRALPLALAAVALGTALTFGAGPARAQAWPAKTVTLVVGNAPGGSNDTFARALAKPLQEALGQPVVVENKPAGGGVIANTMVANAAPDGYTLGVVSSTFTTGAAIRSNLQYDAVKSFTPVARLAKGPLLVTVAADSPLKSIEEVVRIAKADPGKLNYGTSGTGSINHFATELFAAAAGIRLTHIPYKGMGPATADLIGKQIQMLVASVPSIGGQIKNGKVRALAVTSAEPSPVAPGQPALEQLGYKPSATDLWWGILAPANLPEPILTRLNAEINRIVNSDEMKAFFLKEGAEAAAQSPAEFKALVASELDRWRQVAAKANIKAD